MKAFLSPALFLALALALVGAALASETATVAAGRKLALDVCAACHVVASDQPRAPLLKPPAPSFADIVERQNATQAWLRDFLARPHGESRRMSAMPPFLLPSSEVDAVVAYLLSVKR
jgi:mono/diheme cytochrome c family protein